MSYLTYWQTHGYMVLWLMLSSALPGGLETLTRHFQRLREEIERKLGYKGLEFLAVKTREGHGVLHGYLAWKGERNFFVPQVWLSKTWKRIHGASVVWVAAVKRDGKDRRRLSKYIVSQYLAEQNALVRLSASSMRTFGFGVRVVWGEFRQWVPMKDRITLWSAFLAGEEVRATNGDGWSLESARAGWKGWVKPSPKPRGTEPKGEVVGDGRDARDTDQAVLIPPDPAEGVCPHRRRGKRGRAVRVTKP
jgi:hypothetical protein